MDRTASAERGLLREAADASAIERGAPALPRRPAAVPAGKDARGQFTPFRVYTGR